ncbi:MAG: HD-GYP domain-containing protein [Candidatus Omnitrophica bacterium]|nr:HD-GYP domain-containing protein [Candidatus Omnitrophota bacterium]
MIYLFLGIFFSFCAGFIGGIIFYRKRLPSITQDKPKPLTSEKPLGEGIFKSDLEEMIKFREEMSFIFKLNEKLSFTLEKEKIAQYIAEDIQRFLNTVTCVILLYDKYKNVLRMEYALGPRANEFKGLTLQKGESISGTAIKTKAPIMVNDLEDDFHYKSINKENYFKHSFISVPLILKDEIIGVLNVTDKKTNEPFTSQDLTFLVNVSRVAAIAFNNAFLYTQIQESYLKTMTALALIIDARDPYTERHSESVIRYSLAIANEMNLPLKEVEILKRAASVHDIGKIGIRDSVLLKPTKLTPEEFEEIKVHSIKGYQIIASLPFLEEEASLVRHHHERYDGTGYPDGKKGEEIELGARILAVADAFDAMLSERPYRRKLSLKEAKQELIRNKSTQFDPEIVDYLLKAIEKNPDIVQI